MKRLNCIGHRDHGWAKEIGERAKKKQAGLKSTAEMACLLAETQGVLKEPWHVHGTQHSNNMRLEE